MITPSPMTAKKNRIYGAIVFVALAILISGCAPPGPRALLKGKKLLERGDYANSITQLKMATSVLSTNAQAWNYYGVALQHAGQFDDAVSAYQNALKYDRDLVEAHYNLGCLWLEQNKFADAKTEFTAYTLRRSNSPEGWLKLGMAQLKASDLLSAEKSFSTVHSIDNKNAEALNGLGLCRVAKNRADDAAKFFSAAIEAHPDFAPARLNLAIVEDQYLNNDKAALENYQEYLAITPKPDNWDAVNARVNNLQPTKVAIANPPPPKGNEVSTPSPAEIKSSPAISTHAAQATRPQVTKTNSPPQVVRIQPEPVIVGTTIKNETPSAGTKTGSSHNLNPLNWFGSGRNYTNGGVTPLPPPNTNPTPKPPVKLIQPAPPTFPRYLYLSPRKPKTGDHKAALQAFGQARQFENAQQLADAMNSYQKAAALDPAWFEAQYNYGVLAQRQRDFSRALGAYEMALAIQPDSTDARYNLALALKAGGYVTDAVNELKKILASRPNEIRAHLAMGNICAQQLRDTAQARQHYLKVIELDPRNSSAAEIHFWLSANPP
ncbi:MAG TPA: tetratricopeptide repeat protein [Candidatus Baltobacteraceae bacterium]|nr:tetratricopeptide repeat protein [Candidatus Baltobacteraceae bacterium]